MNIKKQHRPSIAQSSMFQYMAVDYFKVSCHILLFQCMPPHITQHVKHQWSTRVSIVFLNICSFILNDTPHWFLFHDFFIIKKLKRGGFIMSSLYRHSLTLLSRASKSNRSLARNPITIVNVNQLDLLPLQAQSILSLQLPTKMSTSQSHKTDD